MAITINTIGIASKVKIDIMGMTLTDLHTHILPGIDDGAKDLEASLKILRKQKECGVERVALTPHFYPMRQELQEFLDRRQLAYEELMRSWDAETMPQLRLSAEVHYSPALAELDLRSLTIGESRYLLLELSDTVYPTHIETILEHIQQQGLIPILAHVERCDYFLERPDRLVRLVKQGALSQVSATAMVEKKEQKFVQTCLKKNVAQIIASDIHDLWEEKYLIGNVASKMDAEIITHAEQFAKAVWDNVLPPAYTAEPIKRTLFGYA